MSILIGKYEFQGPYTTCEQIRPEPGIFGILCRTNNEYELIELDQSSKVDECLRGDEHTSNLMFYAETCHGELSAIVLYTPDMNIEERLDLKNVLLVELNEAAMELAS